MSLDPNVGLWWARPFGRRCRARLEPGADGAGPYHGRCELVPHEAETAHALERGMDVVRFVTAVRASG